MCVQCLRGCKTGRQARQARSAFKHEVGEERAGLQGQQVESKRGRGTDGVDVDRADVDGGRRASSGGAIWRYGDMAMGEQEQTNATGIGREMEGGWWGY